MVGTISVAESAKKSNFPLQPFFAFASAPSHVRIVDVPKQLGSWKITSVNVDITYPDGTSITNPCTLVGGCWSCTFNGCDTVGKVQNGATVKADGIDELGQPVNGYVLGKGDVIVLEAGFDVDPDEEQTAFVKLYSEEPTNPRIGALANIDGWMVYTSDGWQSLGLTLDDLSSKADLSALEDVADSLSSKADLSALDSKQDSLTIEQLSALDNIVQDRATYIAFNDGTISAFNWSGEISFNTMKQYGLYSDSLRRWVKPLTSVKIGTGVSQLGATLFRNCHSLTSVTIPNSVTTIKNSVFSTCSSLTSVAIPDSVTEIGLLAFANCYSFNNIVIPNSVTSIGDSAFSGCLNLSSLSFKGKMMNEITSMPNYPWAISDTSIINTWNDASQEWVQEQIGNVNTALEEIVG